LPLEALASSSTRSSTVADLTWLLLLLLLAYKTPRSRWCGRGMMRRSSKLLGLCSGCLRPPSLMDSSSLYADTEEGRSSGIVRCLLGTTTSLPGLYLGFLWCGSATMMSGADATYSESLSWPKPLMTGTSKSLLLSPSDT
jgi:hypothetical protein